MKTSTHKPSFGIFLTFIYPLFALLLTFFVAGQNLHRLVFPVLAGRPFSVPSCRSGSSR